MASTKVIPEGHTFLNVENFMTTRAKDIAVELFRKADNRNPDIFDMYIYNDFYAYAILDLVDKTLATLHSKITKKDWDEACGILEGLSVFTDMEGTWTQCDDGERVQVTNKVYGASAVTVLRGLQKAGRLNPAEFPSLENLLKTIASFGETMESCSCDSEYAKLAKTFARRIFKNKAEIDFALEKARLNEWVDSFEDEEERDELKADLNKMEEEADDENEKPWFENGKVCDEDEKDPDWVLSRVWKEYKTYLSSVPSGPMRGPGSWDISKWTATQKKPFEFGNDNSGDEY